MLHYEVLCGVVQEELLFLCLKPREKLIALQILTVGPFMGRELVCITNHRMFWVERDL